VGDGVPDRSAELDATKGMVLAHVADGGVPATTNNEPPLTKGEVGRVGPHGHDLVDPGHSHTLTMKHGGGNPPGAAYPFPNGYAAPKDLTYTAATNGTGITVTPVGTSFLPLAYVLVCQQL